MNKSINHNKSGFKLKKFAIFLGLLFLGCILISGAVSASTIYVNPSTYAIKNAIKTAHSGDTLKLSSGNYNEHDLVVNKNLHIVGANQHNTVISGQRMSYIFHINNGAKVTINNIKMVNGNSDYGGAIQNEGNLTITNSIFSYNTANEVYGGGAIYSNWNGILNINNCNFISNKAFHQGGAIYNYGNGRISNTNFTNNIATHGGAIYNDGGLTVDHGIFTKNNAKGSEYSSGGAICNDELLNIYNSKFTSNTGIWGGAIYTHFYLIVKNTNFTKNSANTSGGAILNDADGYVHDGTIIVTNSILTYNTAKNGGAIFNAWTANLHYNTLIGNSHYTLYNIGTMNASRNWWGSNAGPSAGTIYGIVTVKPWTTEPKITKTTPNNMRINVSRTSKLIIRFNEKIKAGSRYNLITIKNLSTHRYVSLTKIIKGNTLYLKTHTRSAHTWYQVRIPARAIKDNNGDNLKTMYTFKFKT